MAENDPRVHEVALPGGNLGWGSKGAAFHPEKCQHERDDGCMWCCIRCNYDTHFCPGCGTVTDHKDSVCDECKVIHNIPD